MSFPPGTEMFQFPGFASRPYVFRSGYSLLSGFPHSDIHGSTPARGSPWLFAACHVLHRLLVPRHPPNALIMLTPRECRTEAQHSHLAQEPSNPSQDQISRPYAAPSVGIREISQPPETDAPSAHPFSLTLLCSQAAGNWRQVSSSGQTVRPSRADAPNPDSQLKEQYGRTPRARPMHDHRWQLFSKPSMLTQSRFPLRRLPSPLWRWTVSNRRPPACKAGALPLSYTPPKGRHAGRYQK